jgi:LacI family transcriptional regulator
MSTIKDVARLAQVSVATVSRVINESPKASAAAREAVYKAMRELGYTPNANARALVSQTSDTIGVLVNDVADPFFGALVKGVAGVAMEQGLHLLVGNGFHRQEQERRSLELLISKRCEALVVHSKALSDAELIDYALRHPGMVLINRDIPALKGRCIALNNQPSCAPIRPSRTAWPAVRAMKRRCGRRGWGWRRSWSSRGRPTRKGASGPCSTCWPRGRR